MEIHIIGHASYLMVAAKGKRVMIDPVLGARHQEGLLETYPRRYVDKKKIKDVDQNLIEGEINRIADS